MNPTRRHYEDLALMVELLAALEAVIAIGPAYWGTHAEKVYENARALIQRIKGTAE